MQDEVTQSVADEIFKRIDQIGEAISQGAVAGWEILIRQQYVSALGFFMFAAVLIAANIVGWKLASASRKKSEALLEDRMNKDASRDRYSYSSWSDIREANNAIDGAKALQFGSLVFGALAMFPLYNALARIINPGYYAIKEVLRIFS